MKTKRDFLCITLVVFFLGVYFVSCLFSRRVFLCVQIKNYYRMVQKEKGRKKKKMRKKINNHYISFCSFFIIIIMFSYFSFAFMYFFLYVYHFNIIIIYYIVYQPSRRWFFLFYIQTVLFLTLRIFLLLFSNLNFIS